MPEIMNLKPIFSILFFDIDISVAFVFVKLKLFAV